MEYSQTFSNKSNKSLKNNQNNFRGSLTANSEPNYQINNYRIENYLHPPNNNITSVSKYSFKFL